MTWDDILMRHVRYDRVWKGQQGGVWTERVWRGTRGALPNPRHNYRYISGELSRP